MHLSPKLYHVVQIVAHGDYSKTLTKLYSLLNINHGDVVVELGCGDGGFAKYFLNKGCKYFGIDLDKERIKIAQQKNPEGKFFASDLMDFDWTSLPQSKKYCCKGLLHHLSDEQCKKLIKKVTSLNKEIKFLAVEPIRPNTWYSNPLGTFFANMDDGKYIRKINPWKELFGPWLETIETMSRRPRWPVDALFAILVPQTKTTDNVF